MTSYKSKIIRAKDTKALTGNIEKELQEMSAKGWELVTISVVGKTKAIAVYKTEKAKEEQGKEAADAKEEKEKKNKEQKEKPKKDKDKNPEKKVKKSVRKKTPAEKEE